MINRNLALRKSDTGYWVQMSRLDNFELDELWRKHEGMVNVKIGRPVSPGTDEQNRAMHSLLAAYYKTGFHSAPDEFSTSLEAFKVWIKMQYGPCWCVDLDGQKTKVPKSWADYSKTERIRLIDGLISEINQSGAYTVSEEIQEIICGMQKEA